MILIIPYQVDVPLSRWPIANYVIIALTVGLFLCQVVFPEEVIKPYILEGWSLQGLLGSMWLHADIFHLAGNMIFLWVFGNAVCAKVGNVSYPFIYVAVGIASGMVHLAFSGEPAIGASGAINGIVGMYLVWYPLNAISCVLLIIVWAKTFLVASYWMILLWLIFDIWGASRGAEMVAYYAHLGGFAAGFALAFGLLRGKVVQMDELEKSLLGIFGGNMSKAQTEPDTDNRWGMFRPDELAADQQQEDASNGPWQVIAPEVSGLDQTAAQRPSDTRPDQTTDEFIRFKCICGKTVKAPRRAAGQTGRCPRCSRRIHIPPA